jgi:hypothetical protein
LIANVDETDTWTDMLVVLTSWPGCGLLILTLMAHHAEDADNMTARNDANVKAQAKCDRVPMKR